MIFCNTCILHFSNITEYVKHTKVKPHQMKQGTPINCPFASCPRLFTFRRSLVKHFLTAHENKVEVPIVPISAELYQSEVLDDLSGNTSNAAVQFEQGSNAVNRTTPPDAAISDCITGESVNLTLDAVPDQIDPMLELKRKIVSFFALVNSFPAIPFSFIQIITDNMISTCSDINDIFIKKLSDIRHHLADEKSKEILSDCIELYNFIDTTFATFKSVYRQVKFFEKEKLYIKPQQKTLRHRLLMRKRKGRYVPVPVKQTSVVIPMREVLSKLLSQDKVLDTILEYKAKLESEKEYLCNIIQGGCWGKIPKKAGGVTLPLAFFNDDFEPDNALGGHAGANKINGSYYTIPCLPPQLKSSLNFMFVAMLTKASNKKYCGNKVTFKPIIDELKYLHKNGIMVRTSDSKDVRIFFQLATLIGDNLGLNGIEGYVENFSKAKFCCRICFADLKARKTMIVEDVSLLRTVEKYEEHLTLNNPSETGIKESCSFNEVPNFHIVLNPTVDPTHDISEGVAKNDILFILKTYIHDYGILTVSDLNGRISRFPFGSADMSNKPPIFGAGCFKKKSFNVSASECMCLVKHLGLLIGDLVPPGDPVWNLYIALRRIVDIVFSPSLHKDSSHLLKTYVQEHHSIYLDLTKKHLTLKYHNLIHYPGLIPKIGPLRELGCLRFDGKHRSLKSTCNTIASRRDVCFSSAKKQQLLLSFNFFSSKYSKDNLKWGSNKTNFSRNFLAHNLTTPVPECLMKNDTVQTSWVQVHGTRYSRGVSLYVDIDEELSFPLFGEILEIYITGAKKIYFLIKNFQTVSFNEKLFAYQVHRTKSASIFQYDELQDYQLHSAVPVKGGNLYISLLNNC